MAEENKQKEETAPETEAEAPQAEEPAPETGAMSEQELREKLEEHFREQRVSDVLMQFLVSLSTLAYVKMGLTEDAEKYKDLEQASLAIDAFKALLESAQSRLPEQDAKALAGALASMQVTFARSSSGGESAGDEDKKKDDPSSRIWVPGKE